MPYIITEVPQLCGGINLVPPRRIGSKKRVCGVFVDTCQKILNWIEIVCKKFACNLNKIGCFLYESWTLSLSLSLTLSFIRWNIRENIYRNESYLEILAITNKKQIYFYAAKIIYIIIHVISLSQWIQLFTIVSELKDVVNFFRVLAVHFRVTDGSKHDVQKNRNGGHTQNHQPAHDQQEWHKYKLKVDNKEHLFKFSNFEGSHAILINTLLTLYACSIAACKTISFFFTLDSWSTMILKSIKWKNSLCL